MQRVGKCLITYNEQLTLIKETREWTREWTTSIAKKRLLRKKYKKHSISSFQTTKTTQTSGSAFAERIEKVKKTKFELQLIKIVDCLLDGHGNYDSDLVTFQTKFL